MALDFVAGCMGGCAGILVGHPLDTIKVCLQTQSGSGINSQYRNTFHCFKSIFIKEGIKGIYKGVTSPLLGVAGINAFVFGIYGNAQRNMTNPDSLQSHAIAGALAGLVQSFITSPMELIKSRMQIGDKTGNSVIDLAKKIYQKNGLKGIFRGINITIIREVPAFSSYFITYEFLSRRDDDLPITTSAMLMAGGLAGVVSWAIVYPIDVIKSRYQIDGIQIKKYTSSYDCFNKSIKQDGAQCLFRGLTPTLIRAFPVNAVIFTVVTWTMKIFDTIHLEETELRIMKKCSDVVNLSTVEFDF